MKPSRPKSYRETVTDNHKALDYYAAMAGVKPVPRAINLPAKRERVKSSGEDLEAPVVAAVGELLARHPKVLFAIRQNGGAMFRDGENGRQIPIWFYRWAKSGPERMRLPDYWGMMKDGRLFCIECKKPSWVTVRGPRETEQHNFIAMVISAGGIGGFAPTVDDALAILGD